MWSKVVNKQIFCEVNSVIVTKVTSPHKRRYLHWPSQVSAMRIAVEASERHVRFIFCKHSIKTAIKEDTRDDELKKRGMVQHGVWKLKRVRKMVRSCPEKTMWEQLFRIYHLIWRGINGWWWKTIRIQNLKICGWIVPGYLFSITKSAE